MFAVVTSVGLIGLRLTIAVIRFGLRVAGISLKLISGVLLLSMLLVFSMPRMIGT